MLLELAVIEVLGESVHLPDLVVARHRPSATMTFQISMISKKRCLNL